MKKQIVSVLLTCAMMAAILSGCGQDHVHQTTDTWDVNLTSHWKICTDCGETAEEDAHTLDEADQCTVCGAQIIDYGDSKSLYLDNDNGDMLKMADYDQNGNVMTETICQ